MKKVIISVILGLIILSSCNNSKEMNEKAEYAGADISKNLEILKDIENKTTSLKVSTGGKWYLFAGTDTENIDISKPVAEGEGSGTFLIDIPFDEHYYFLFKTGDSKAILAEKHLPMKGGHNFRDLGGIRTSDGKYVKWGKIFRGDELAYLTEEDLEYLSKIPIVSVVDFRSQSEISNAPDKNPSSVIKNYQFSISPGNLTQSAEIDMNKITITEADSIMIGLNRLLVTDSTSINRYRDFFALLQNEENVPLLFHCTAGKDRTGMGAALILFSLGVDENTIMEDYLLSNKYLESKYGAYKSKYPEIKSLFEVKPEFILAGITTIKEEHGSVEKYLTDVLDVDIEKMKKLYLYQ